MELYAAIAFSVLNFGLILYLLSKVSQSKSINYDIQFKELAASLLRIEQVQKEEFRINRDESNKNSKENREELNNTLKEFKKELTDTLKLITVINNSNSKSVMDNNNLLKEEIKKSFKEFGDTFEKGILSFNNVQKEKLEQIDKQLSQLLIMSNRIEITSFKNLP
jgi:DNA recombination protein RmuC